MPSDGDYYAMALGRNPEIFTAEQIRYMRQVISEEEEQERKWLEKLENEQRGKQ